MNEKAQKFTIGIVGVMSAGKSTLLNALMGRALLPARNLATTAAAMYIYHDSDAAQFTARAACTREALEDVCFELADRDLLDAWNDVFPFIEIRGCLPFLRDAGIHGSVTLVDTPGPNNSMDERHGLTTRSVLQFGDISLLLHVWNASQLATRDDRNFLREVEAWRQTSPVPELFVLNRMDCFDPEKESLAESLKSMQRYLAEENVSFPQITGTSARLALYFRMREALSARERERLEDFVEECGRFRDFYERAYANVDPVLDGAFTELVGTLKREHRMQELSFLNTGVPMLEAVILDHVRRLCPKIVSQKEEDACIRLS
ncbi:MAG TPA: dynamin family protein [Candidatus Mailhella merdavium]|nr:dynamin family protein [Candidatus Mailhella merdavium]